MRRLVASLILLSCSLPAFATMQTKPVEWSIGKDRFSGVLVYDDVNNFKRPGLVMVPNWMGVSDNAIAMAKTIAGDKYVVLVADVYGKDIRPKNVEQAEAAVKQAYADGGKTLRERTLKAVEALKAQDQGSPVDSNRIGALGFCFGGSTALELARSGAELEGGVVSFHGGLDAYRPVDGGKVNTSLLVLNGAADESVTAQSIQAFEKEMDGAQADWQFVNFSGAKHCFSQPEDADKPQTGNCVYDKRAATRSMRMMRDFFDERFAGSLR